MRSLLAYSTTSTVEEKLTLRIKADSSGDIYLPTAGYSTEGTQNCAYDWMVSIDGNEPVEYKGTGSANGKIRVGYGLVGLSTHSVVISPKVDDYGWLRAFGYKGTDIASSLINIISDKSYNGFALSDQYSGDYFKAYQYYGCTNLVNTDEELLPDTLEIIGDYYRYYEYAGCTSLVSNAEEKILKTVKVIGDYYRAYQYQNCTGINRIDMRAINWASVGNNYRLNQLSGVASDKKPADIYIEGGIEEGGSWGLVNDNVKGVYVYEGLVTDYQTKLSTITSSKIKKNAAWDNYEYEFIEYIALADSTGKIRIPVGGYSTSFTQDCVYDWYVSIDGGEPDEISGTGSASYVSVGSGLTEGSEHRVVIKPATVAYGWGRAFGFHTTGAQAYIKELIHDSYKCFASSRTSTGAHYKHGTFTGCTNLINSYEKLPTSVETVGDYYMKECYAGCTALVSAFWEVMHKGCSIGEDFRHTEYYGCTAMEIHQGVAGYTGTYPTNYRYQYLSGAGSSNNLNVYMTRYEALDSGLTNSMGLSSTTLGTLYSFIDDCEEYRNNTYWSDVASCGHLGYYFWYQPVENKWIDQFTELSEEYTFVLDGGRAWGDGLAVRGGYLYANNTYNYASGGGTTWDGATYKFEIGDGVLTKTAMVLNSNGGDTNSKHRGLFVDFKGYAYTGYERAGNNDRIYAISTMPSFGFSYGEYSLHWNSGMFSMSRNGKIFFYTFDTYVSKRVTFNTRFTWGIKQQEDLGTYYKNGLDFTDDGRYAYIGEGGYIKQYVLKTAWDLSSKEYTGKQIACSGDWALDDKKENLYIKEGDTVKRYSYVE